MRPTGQVRRAALAAAVTAAAAVLAGCGAVSVAGSAPSSGTPSGGSGGSSATTQLSHLLPADVRAAGQVVVATDPTYPPFETLSGDQQTIQGLDPDLLRAVAAKLGIKVQFTKAGFDSIIPGLQAGRYAMAMSAMTDTRARESQVTFVDYFQVGGAIVMAAGDPAQKQPMPEALCGKTVGVQTGSITAMLSVQDSKKCTTEGKPSIRLTDFPSIPASVLALNAGRVQYVWTDSVSAAAQVSSGNGKFAAVSDGTPMQPSGIVFPKGSAQLAAAFQAGLQAIIADGSYQHLLAHYGLQSGAVQAAGTDQARS